MQLVMRRADTGAVIASSGGDADDPQTADTLLRGMLAEARLTSRVREYEVSVTRLLETAEIARYCDGRKV